MGVHEQKDGRFYIGAAPVVGRSSGTTLTALADLLEAHGSTRLRTTPHQKIVVLDVERDRVDAVVAGLKELGLDPEPSVFRRSTIACTGLEFCKLAIVDTKDTATAAIAQLEERLADLADRLPERLSLHVNGCPNSCARIQTADIGLKGQYIGEEYVFQVHLGGGLASPDREEGGLGRTVRGLKVTADDLSDYVERVTRTFLRERGPEQSFAEWALSAEEDSLR